MTAKPRTKKYEPWHPYEWSKFDAASLQALARGDATEHQQQHALKLIVEGLAGTYDKTYHADSERNSAFAEGKRHVGLEIVKLLKLNLAAFKDKD